MVKAIIGLKGSGKTKTLVDMANNAAKAANGNVVYIEKGNTLMYDVSYQARLVDVDDYAIADYDAFYGFVAGLVAGNHDINEIYIDGITKICGSEIAALEKFLQKVDKLAGEEITVTLTASCDPGDATDVIKSYLI